jgi:hypothetical protein
MKEISIPTNSQIITLKLYVYIKQGNMIPPKGHNTLITKSQNTKIAERPNNSKIYLKQ